MDGRTDDDDPPTITVYEPVTSVLCYFHKCNVACGENSVAVWLKRLKGDVAYRMTINPFFITFKCCVTTNKMLHAFTLYRFLNLNVPKTAHVMAAALRWQAGVTNSMSADASADLFKVKVWINTRDSNSPLQTIPRSAESKPSVALAETFQLLKCSFFT